MKNIFKIFTLFLVLLVLVSGCGSSKYSSRSLHNRGVNNRGYQGY